MKRNKLSKPILLSTLVFGQCAGTVVAMQNSIVQVYAEQKNKEVTSQEFLDYINQLKEQNPNFKFSQGETKVFESEEQALANLAEQKQAINTAIANYKQAVEERNTRYEQEKRDVAERNELIKQENLQKEQEYQAKLSTYNAKKAEVEQWKLANPIITELDNGIKLRGNYDESKKNSINYFDNIAIDASKELLENGGYETTSKSIKMSPNSTVEVVNASSALIDNTNGYIGGMTLDNYPVKTIKSWRIKAGTPTGELLNMNLRNIGETDSGKTISAHVKFILDYATSDAPQVSNAEGSINVVKDGLLHMYWLPKSDNSSDKQGGHYEIQFYDDATGQPIKLANLITLCSECHHLAHSSEEQLLAFQKKFGKKAMGTLKYAAQMNVLRHMLQMEYPDVEITYGFITKDVRRVFGLEKSHTVDACCIASRGSEFHNKNSNRYKKKCVAKCDYARTYVCGRKFTILPKSKIAGFKRYDKVLYSNKEYFVAGRKARGYVYLIDIDNRRVQVERMRRGTGERYMSKAEIKVSLVRKMASAKTCLCTREG